MSVFLRYDAAPFGAGAKVLICPRLILQWAGLFRTLDLRQLGKRLAAMLCPQQPILAQRPIGELSAGGRIA
ncbi:hypothetical protein B7W85_25870 [Allorhizobium ampelinum]|nr:hypothetical protein BBL07_14580 [Agrobacterium vitis]OVE87575.1 hypothetical protein B7W85_25870 [Allorhizobium ampelinum]BCH62161.1 hypothetical protein RvVAR0630_pl03030 [Agrobacterium vitis]